MIEILPNNPIPKTVYRLFLNNATGRVVVRLNGRDAFLWVQNGAPIASELHEHGFHIADLCVEMGFLSVNEASALFSGPNAALSQSQTYALLAERNIVSPRKIERLKSEKLLRDFARLCLVETPVEFREGDVPGPNYAPGALNLFFALFFIFQYYSTPDQITLMESNFSNKLLKPTTNLKYMLPQMEIDDRIKQALLDWENPRSISDVYAVSGLNHREVVAMVSMLVMVDALDVSPQTQTAKPTRPQQTAAQASSFTQTKAPPRPQSTSPASAAKPQEMQTKSASSTPDPARATSANRSTKISSQTPVEHTADDTTLTVEQRALKQDIKRFSGLIESHNPLKILGLTAKAGNAEIKKAYSTLARKFHPDKFATGPLNGYSSECEKIFAAIGNAMQTLVRPDLRKEFEAALIDPTVNGNMKHWEQKKRAEFEIEKTKVFIRKHDFGQAASAANRALTIFPHDPSVLAMLAWAKYNLASDKAAGMDLAFKILERADKLAANSPAPEHFRGMILKQENRLEEAKEAFEKALSYHPHSPETAREIEQLNQVLKKR